MLGAVVKTPGMPAQYARLHARRTRWRPSHRVVPSRFPPVGLFDRVAAPEDLEAVFALEAMTNDRLREEAGELSLVAKEDRVSGPGTTPIMAAFTHLNPEGSRFSDGSFGVYYCAQKLETALAEVRYHQERFLLRTREGLLRLELRLYLADLDARLVDVRRSEERRVGKECRSRGSPYHLKKNKNWLPQAQALLAVKCYVELPVTLEELKLGHRDLIFFSSRRRHTRS